MNAFRNPLSFSDACDFLYPRTGGTERAWSLEPTRRLLDRLGHPQRQYDVIHVGGSNGKGSVATMVACILRASGRSVGLYTSPHLVDVRERMIVDGRPISRDAFSMWTYQLCVAIDGVDASFFEATTAIALADFAARSVDVAVVEVGLGGRLDSTNVVSPVVCGVTNVSLEHRDYLGDTLESIAREKAGIAKAGVPFVIGEPQPDLAVVLRRAAEQAGATVVQVPPDQEYEGPMGLIGLHQRRNAAVAQAILQARPERIGVGESAVQDGLAAAWVPGRFDRRGKWLFDVAHNAAGMGALRQTLESNPVPQPIHVLFGVLDDKAALSMLSTIQSVADVVWVTSPPTAPANRVTDLAVFEAEVGPRVVIEADFESALAGVQRGAATILVTGSFHTVGDAMARLPGFQPYG